MKKKITILSVCGILAIIFGVIILNINKEIKNNKIEILDATYICDNILEQFYEDNKYIYYFPCTKSTSLYLKYPDGNKILVKTALEDNTITIEELLKLDVEVIKKEK